MSTSNRGRILTHHPVKLLIIESDAVLCDTLAAALTAEGYLVTSSYTGKNALRLFFQIHPALVVLGLPVAEADSWTILRRVREIADTPVLMLVHKNDRPGEVLRALQSGASDCVAASVTIEEVVLRIKAIMRRHRPHEQQVYDDGVLHVDAWRREVTVNGQRVHVTHPELCLLACLVQQPGHVVTYEEIYEELNRLIGPDGEPVLHSLLSRLRRKLRRAGAPAPRIVAQRGLGLRLEVPPPSDVGQEE